MPQTFRKSKILLCLLAPVLIATPVIASAAGSDDKPNIVLVLTPKIDSIAAEGLQLTNYNVEAECTPSRASLMTGRYGIRTRQVPNGPPRGVWYGITRWEHTLAEMLSESGYATALFGKWHLGDTEGRFPTDQGFDEWIGIPRSSDRAFWPDSNSFTPGSHPDAVFTHVMSAKRGEKPQEHEVYGREKRKTIDREITDQSIDFIKRKADGEQPFFVFLSYTQTHEPVDPHPDYYGKTGNGSFADVLAQTDDYVGEVLETLDNLGLKEDTIVIFTADNGREGVPRSFGFTGPWRSGMFSPYEGSLRVPFLMRWPGKIPSGRVSNEIMHAVDVLPTVAAIIGSELPSDRVYDGADQTAFLTGKTTKSARESVVIYIGNVLFGVKWRNWKLLLKEMDEDTYAIRDIAYPSIYNLVVDPKEEVPELNYLNDTWVDFPLYQVLEDHEASIAEDPGAPGP
jgi:arylsulfatase